MEPRYVAVIGMHVVVALAFVALAVRNALHGDIVNATLQGVIGALVLFLGVGITRIA
ncbi:hypothetical protein KY092_17220 [Natronomonas gomsonensis]|uniref:hypothetical protein n=1 Tax=Natronomonas gomsonensis TaxID=1046043 RepID=UPI0020CA366C|nr:hypothetical protein [Natronomonas gomsonensis]MCY4732296.1 hypothetical protein [Natronomonas gomsonensis]